MTDALRILKEKGVLVRDDLLPSETFDIHRSAVQNSWSSGTGWNTRIKAGSEAKTFPRQSQDAVDKLRELVRGHEDKTFQYLYHSMHEENDTRSAIKPILHDVRRAWADVIDQIAPKTRATNFSLSSFTPGCFLDEHTDHTDNENPYLVTILLYFGGAAEGQGGLIFDFDGHRQTISPNANRSILFVPTPETAHWIETVPNGAAPRLALSGWLL